MVFIHTHTHTTHTHTHTLHTHTHYTHTHTTHTHTHTLHTHTHTHYTHTHTHTHYTHTHTHYTQDDLLNAKKRIVHLTEQLHRYQQVPLHCIYTASTLYIHYSCDSNSVYTTCTCSISIFLSNYPGPRWPTTLTNQHSGEFHTQLLCEYHWEPDHCSLVC